MTKEQVEHLAIGLETLSFVLTTTDLFGKKRLALQRKKFNAIRLNNIKLNFRNILINIYKRIHWFAIAIVLINVIIDIMVYHYRHKLALLYMEHNPFLEHLWITTSAVTVLLYLFINFVAYIAFYFFYGIFSALQLLTVIFPLEGLMLAIGTTLFFTSKIITYVNT